MPAKVTLEITRGDLAGQTLVFDERTTCVMGRGTDCNQRLLCNPAEPKAPENRKISRHHCLLDINPPDVRVRDIGSLNGTWVNGKVIGRRKKGQTAEEAAGVMLPEYDLNDGDEIRLGTIVIRVKIEKPVLCARCGCELADPPQPGHPESTLERLCKTCRPILEQQQAARPRRRTVVEELRICAHCGQSVAGESGADREGDYVCAQCRANPVKLLDQLFDNVNDAPAKPAVIGGYELIDTLGAGGMGAVYLARDKRHGREVAVKVMLPKVAANEKATARFLREMENTRALQHAHVVRAYESGCLHGMFFLTMELCDGGSVDGLMEKKGGRLRASEAVGIILQVLEGLAYAHQAPIPHVQRKDGTVGQGRGLVHRDIKPQNIFLCKTPHGPIAKIGDYGLSKAFDQAGLSGLTTAESIGGSPPFMPKQQVLDFGGARPEVDVWAAAASLYNMLTGYYARDFPDEADVWCTILQSRPVPIRERGIRIPARLAEVVDAALQDEPDIRYKTAAEFAQALREVIR